MTKPLTKNEKLLSFGGPNIFREEDVRDAVNQLILCCPDEDGSMVGFIKATFPVFFDEEEIQ